MKAGDTFKVTKGNKTIGLLAHNFGRVREVQETDRGVRVVLAPTFGPKTVTVWARYAKSLEKPQVNLGNGDGINTISITTFPK